MKTLLHIDSSAKGAESVTRALTAEYVAKWKAANPNGRVISRDLAASDLKFVTPQSIGAAYTPKEARTAEQAKGLEQSDALIRELIEADEYVFGVPMYNFTVPAVFKAYVDLVARPNETFTYATGTPTGLLKNKQLVLVTASGGDYSAPPMNGYDFVEPYIRAMFGFLGVNNIDVIKAHGSDPDTIQKTTTAAKKTIDSLFASPVRS